MRNSLRIILLVLLTNWNFISGSGLCTENIVYDFSDNSNPFSITDGFGKLRNQDQGQVLALRGDFPGMCGFAKSFEFGSKNIKAIELEIFLPEDIPWGTEVSLFLKDKDGVWFHADLKDSLEKSKWNKLAFNLNPEKSNFMPLGHEGTWNEYYLKHSTNFGFKIFSPDKYSGEVLVKKVTLHTATESNEALSINNFRFVRNSGLSYEQQEFSFNLTRPVANPFDSEEIEVNAEFLTPEKKKLTIPAFYSQEYRRELNTDQVEKICPVGKSAWHVRFTPLEAGDYLWRIRAKKNGKELLTEPHMWKIKKGKPQGFVRVSKEDGRYFEDAAGNFFYPIGLNIHAPFDKRCAQMLGTPVLPNRGTYAYDYYFEKMSRNGMNAVVIWMSNWWVSIEWTKGWKGFGGLTDYNLGNAWRIDRILESAAKYGIYVNLVLDNHGKFSGFVDSEWETNPYNAALGGPCKRIEDFFEKQEAFDIYKKRLRYIVARWNSHPNLLGLEIISEMNLVGTDRYYKGNPAHAVWVKSVAEYLDLIDPYRRPITIQYSNDFWAVDSKVVSLEQLDYLVGDAYKAGGSIVPLILKTAEMNCRYNKPTFSAEFGGNWNGTTPARLHADLHAGLWSNAMTQTAGAPFFWWFDYVDRYNLYPEFKILRDFMSTIDQRGKEFTLTKPTVYEDGKETNDLEALLFSTGNEAYFYIYEKFSSEVMPELEFANEHKNIEIAVPQNMPRNLKVELWNTFNGEIRTLNIANKQKFKIAAMKIDVAGKILTQK